MRVAYRLVSAAALPGVRVRTSENHTPPLQTYHRRHASYLLTVMCVCVAGGYRVYRVHRARASKEDEEGGVGKTIHFFGGFVALWKCKGTQQSNNTRLWGGGGGEISMPGFYSDARRLSLSTFSPSTAVSTVGTRCTHGMGVGFEGWHDTVEVLWTTLQETPRPVSRRFSASVAQKKCSTAVSAEVGESPAPFFYSTTGVGGWGAGRSLYGTTVGDMMRVRSACSGKNTKKMAHVAQDVVPQR